MAAGWFLNELSQHLKTRRERKAATGRALADLLEIHHYLKGIELVFGEIQKWAPMSRAQVLEGMSWISQLVPPDPTLPERYQNAVTEISATDPLLAFRLRSKDQIPALLERLRAVQGLDMTTKDFISATDEFLRSAANQGIEDSIAELAYAHGVGTWFRIRNVMRRRSTVPRELSRFIQAAATENVSTAHPAQ